MCQTGLCGSWCLQMMLSFADREGGWSKGGARQGMCVSHIDTHIVIVHIGQMVFDITCWILLGKKDI